MSEALYTLKELAEKAGVSYPTASNYKRQHQDRIPTVGSGRKQRYPEEAVAVFQAIRQENEGKGGRRRESARTKPKVATKPNESDSSLLMLGQLAQRSGVSLATAQRYTKQHLDRLPHVGKGRKRRYKPEAVDVVREIRTGSRGKGRRSPTADNSTPNARQVADLLRELRHAHEELLRKVVELSQAVSKPIEVTLQRS